MTKKEHAKRLAIVLYPHYNHAKGALYQIVIQQLEANANLSVNLEDIHGQKVKANLLEVGATWIVGPHAFHAAEVKNIVWEPYADVLHICLGRPFTA